MTRDSAPAEAFARALLRQAGWGAAIIVVGGLWLALDLGARSAAPSGLARSLAFGAYACAAAALCVCAWLGFDALLFRLIGSYDDPAKGCRAADEVLSRMRLKPSPDVTRSVEERIAGTHRLILRQRLLVAAFSIAAVLTLLMRSA